MHSFTNSRETVLSALEKGKNFHFSTSFANKLRNKSSKFSVDFTHCVCHGLDLDIMDFDCLSQD
jgi:hypothetical protein